VHNEIAHVSVIDCLLRLGFPRRIGARVARINAHDVQLAEIPELDLVQVCKLAAEDEMELLAVFRLVRHASLVSGGKHRNHANSASRSRMSSSKTA
jgi:hypothetical protein